MEKTKIYICEDDVAILLAGLSVYESWLMRYDSRKDKYYQDLLSDLDRIRNTLRYYVIECIEKEL